MNEYLLAIRRQMSATWSNLSSDTTKPSIKMSRRRTPACKTRPPKAKRDVTRRMFNIKKPRYFTWKHDTCFTINFIARRYLHSTAQLWVIHKECSTCGIPPNYPPSHTSCKKTKKTGSRLHSWKNNNIVCTYIY